MRHNHCSQSLHLPNPAYAHSVISLSIFQSYRRVRRGTLTRLLCFLLIFNLLLLPGSAITLAEAVRLASKAGSLFTDPFQSAAHLFLSRRVKSPRQLETVVSRTSRVASIEISPRKLVGYQGLRISFTAIGLDSQGSAVQGAKLNWASSDSTSLQIDDSGQATLIKPGLVWVTVSTPFVQARAPVLIKPGLKPHQTDPEWDADQSLLRFDGTIIGSADGAPADLRGLLAAMPDAVVATPLPQSGGGDSGDFLYDELWSEPRNLVGSPRNRAMTSCAVGSILPEGSNFELSIPLWGLPGRGLPLSLSLNYNSRVWSRHSSAVTFNAVNTWPYLGFSISFGRIVTYDTNPNTKFVLIESDGTRRYLGSGNSTQTLTYQTNDGSHITYVGSGSGGTLYYNNGVRKNVSSVNNRLLVTSIVDPNGNYITIGYANQSTPCQDNTGKVGYIWRQAISSITDTLGRVIQFNYDCLNYLTSITVPGLNDTQTVIARFDYAMLIPSTSFSGLTVENVPSPGNTVGILKHIYFPTTQTGYLFTYSAYGMIYNVSLRKGMTYNETDGTITDGTEKAYVSFNYPTTASSLTDAPAFSQWTQFPAATLGGTATWSFTTTSGTGTKAFTITRPDSSTLTLTRSDTAGAVDFGLMTQSEVKTSGGISMSKSAISYANDPGGKPQVANIVSYDDATPTPNQTKVDFDYDSYGNVTNTREYGFQQGGLWVVRRRSRSVYKTDASYVNAYLRSLVIESDVYDAQLDTNDANDVLVAKSTYTYDDYAAMGGMENYGGTASPPGHLSSYDTTVTVRGNLTGRTVYTDVSAPSSTTWLMKLDIFGNVTQEQLACCNMQTTTFADTNAYALAESVTKGQSGGAQVTTSATYDFNTSATQTTTDPNSLVTTVNSRDNLLRPTLITYPTGATSSFSYDDNTPSVGTTISYTDDGSAKSVSTTTVYDNWGRVIQQRNTHGGQVNTNYDRLGRVSSVSNPFAVGGSPSYWTSYTYDALGRTTVVTLPDNQTIQSSYNGNSVTVTDQVNRKIQRITDGLGRLVTVNEQDSSGNLTQATNYTYDVLDNLVEVNQGGQIRKFKYDAIGRLLYEKIPEQSATINDGTGTFWTCKYTYTTFNAVASRQDARGVITTYSYDTLNRLYQISYNTVSGVVSAPT
ncbi:MAG TPA: hypothetical protein VNN73_18855, partial [Blastocatellia bacterium]|nr:hypothetical protein [Blastocatellia bacterium]